MSKLLSTRLWNSPVGPIAIGGDDDALHFLKILGEGERISKDGPGAVTIDRAVAQLEAWFDHRIEAFDLPLAPATSPRGAALRTAIADIPYGATASYGEVARRAASGPRAIGQACRRNPFTIVIPCHRVIGAQQALGHYSAGKGLATKQWLIDHEREIPNP